MPRCKPPLHQNTIDDILQRIDFTDDCWLWTGGKNHRGYGVVGFDSRVFAAHRLVWKLSGLFLDPDLTLDHLCRVHACVNPDHLEQVTLGENIRRASALITHCPSGHPYDEVNTLINKVGARCCRACSRQKSRELYWKKKASA